MANTNVTPNAGSLSLSRAVSTILTPATGALVAAGVAGSLVAGLVVGTFTPASADTFDRAGETPLAAPWVTAGGFSAGIRTDGTTARGSGGFGSPSASLYRGVNYPPEQFSEVVLAPAVMDDTGGPYVRGSTSVAQGYTLNGVTRDWTVYKVTAGPTFTSIASGPWPGATPLVATEPERPRVFLDTPYVTPTGATITVNGGGDLQVALNAALPGDKIVLAAGATFTGNFTLPAKSGNDWIYIQSSALASLPAEGTRVSIANAAFMPRIRSTNTSPAISTATGAHHFRFVGIEIDTTSGSNFNLVSLDTGAVALVNVPNDFVFDRCYIHGNSFGNTRRGILMNSSRTAVVDSYLSDFHEVGADSQAIACWNGPGPFKIVNSYLEGAGENVMFGGADPSIANLVPSDIEFRNNLCFKPLTWRVEDPSYAGLHWSIKNLFELKNAKRVLIDGNTFDRCWHDAQLGFGIVFTVRNQDGTASWSTVEDVTFTNNLVMHVGCGMNTGATDNNFASQTQARIVIRNNYFDISGTSWNGTGEWIRLAGGGIDYTIDHNTAFNDGHPILFTTATGNLPAVTNTRLTITNNLCDYGPFGIFGDLGLGFDADALADYAPTGVVRRNVFDMRFSQVGPTPGNPVTDNFYPLTLNDIGFDFSTVPPTLLSSSPYKIAALDGKPIGIASMPAIPPAVPTVGDRIRLTVVGGATTVLSVSLNGTAAPATSGSLVDASSPALTGSPGIAARADDGFKSESWLGGRAQGQGVGDLSLDGYVPTVRVTRLLTPATGTLAISGVQIGGAGGNITLTPAAGALTATGVAPSRFASTVLTPATGGLTLSIQRSLTPATGALSLTGQQPQVGGAAGIPTGTLTLTGAAPTRIVGTLIRPSAGALTTTGQLATLSGVSFQPGTGSLTLTGAAPTIDAGTQGGSFSFFAFWLGGAGAGVETKAPNTAALAITGVAPIRRVDVRIAPTAGALTAAGAAPQVLFAITSLTPSTGSLAITGAQPSTVGGTGRQPAAGTLALTGTAAVPMTDTVRTSPTGSLALASVAGVARVDIVAVPSVGALSLTGVAPRLNLSITPATGALEIDGTFTSFPGVTNLGVLRGALALTGYQPTVIAGTARAVAPDTGSLAVTGQTGTIDRSKFFTPDTGSLALTGQIATSQVGQTILVPTTGAVSISGGVPNVEVPPRLVPGTGALALAGSVPTLGISPGITPATGALAVQGQAARIGGPTITPNAGTLAIEGTAPFIPPFDSGNQEVIPEGGELTLTGGGAFGGAEGFAPSVVFRVPIRPSVFRVPKEPT